MPVYEIEGSDGGIYEIDVAEGQDPAEAARLYLSSSTDLPDEQIQTDNSGTLKTGLNVVRAIASPIGSALRAAEQYLPWGKEIKSARLGLEMGASDPFVGVGQLAANLTPYSDQMNRWVSEREHRYQKSTKDSPVLSGGGRLIGNIVNPANFVPIGRVAQGANALTRVGTGAITGAGMSASMPVPDTLSGFWQEKGEQALVGGAVGGLIPGVSAIRGGFMNPRMQQEAKKLIGQGIVPTPGQMIGGRWRQIEEQQRSNPLFTSAITKAEKEGVEQLNKNVVNRTLGNIGETLPDNLSMGNEAVDYVAKRVGNRYDELLPNLTGKIDQEFDDALMTMRQMASGLPDKQADQVRRIIKDDVVGRFTNSGLARGETLKDIESRLGSIYRAGIKSDNIYKQDVANASKELQSQLRAMIERNNPQYSGELQGINRAWRDYDLLANAVGRQGAEKGFSPAQLSAAVKAGDISKHRRSFAKGSANMQDISGPGASVLKNKEPDSGTAGRILQSLGATAPFGIAAGAAPGMALPVAASMWAGGKALYSQPGRRMIADLLDRPIPGSLPYNPILPRIGGMLSGRLNVDQDERVTRR